MKKLFGVYLGGTSQGSHIEMHDIAFAVGDCIENVFPQLEHSWFGTKSSAHVDSWVDLSEVDGYRLRLKPLARRHSPARAANGKKLYLVNIGFYLKGVFGEQHRFHFLVGQSKEEARARAKKLYESATVMPHLDNLIAVEEILEIAEVDGYALVFTKGKKSALEIHNVYWPLRKKRKKATG